MKFNINDLDEDKLFESISREMPGIHANNQSRRNRTTDEIFNSTLRGHAVERYLIENHGYYDNPKKYHDVISSTGIEIECKAVDKKWCKDCYILEDPNGYNIKSWQKNYKNYNDARYVVVFGESNGDYEYFATLDLETGNKVEFIK